MFGIAEYRLGVLPLSSPIFTFIHVEKGLFAIKSFVVSCLKQGR